LHFGFRHARRAFSLTVAGCGHGAEKGQEEKFRREVETAVAALRSEGMAAFAEKFAYGAPFVQFKNKDPRGFEQFKRELAEHSAIGSANTRFGVQGQRPSLYDLVDKMNAMITPTLVLTGDEDWPCLQPALLMKQNIPTAALSVIPNCGHTINIEAPDQFNRLVGDFIVQGTPAAGLNAIPELLPPPSLECVELSSPVGDVTLTLQRR
jgi:pimeloyl-ACP methyl ester carboxylesterase